MSVIILKSAPYLFMLGLLLVVMDGLWVVQTYNAYETYPREAFLFMLIGLGIMLIAFILIKRNTKKLASELDINKHNKAEKVIEKENYISRIIKQLEKTKNKWFGILLVMLVFIGIFDIEFALSLLRPILFLFMLFFSFFFIMSGEREDTLKETFEPKSDAMRKLLQLIDYRVHPFSIALILFILIVLTFLITKQFGIELSLETSGNPMYVMSLPSGTFILSGLLIACSFMFIHQHCNFFGIRKAEQGQYKLFQIHFFEIIACGSALMIWIVILMMDVVFG